MTTVNPELEVMTIAMIEGGATSIGTATVMMRPVITGTKCNEYYNNNNNIKN